MFNTKGELEFNIAALSSTILNMAYPDLSNGLLNATLVLSNLPDRITRIERTVQAAAGGEPDVVRLDTLVWNNGAGTGTLVSRSDTFTGGTHSWQTLYGDASLAVVTQVTNVVDGLGDRYSTNIAPDGSYVVSLYYLGRLTNVVRMNSLGSQVSSTAYSYDTHGRQAGVTDARNGTTGYGYNSADLISSNTTPNPGTLGGAAETTSTYYNQMLQATNVVNADGTIVTTEYYLTGQTKRQYGARTYAAGYSFDYAGRIATMTNWTSFATGAGARVTTWNYDPYRGWLNSKAYPDNTGPSYTYTAAGRLQVRLWARGVGTTNLYEGSGLLSAVNYSDSTPWVSNTYDRRGRLSSVVRNGITTTLKYNNAGQQLSESYAGGLLDAISVTNGYDQFLRRTNLFSQYSTTPLLQDSFSYDPASRLQAVQDGAGNGAVYSYIANSPLVSQIVFTNNGATRMTTTKQYDFLSRLVAINNLPSASQPVSFAYDYNSANQRVRRTDADGSYWRYRYDSLGQVISGKKYWSDETPVAGQQFEYAFDDIGNRTQTKAGGDASGANERIANYSANNLNQYTNRDVPGYVDIMGLAYATNPVTVNGTTAYRHGEYFRQELSVNNSTSPVWESVTVSAAGQTTVNGNKFLAKTPEPFTYDADGNLLTDGRWNYGWDAENRLVAMTNNNSSVGPQQVLRFEYDWRNRRIHKQMWPNGAGTNTPSIDLKMIYDVWNVICDLGTNNSALRAYMWALDVSGSFQGAGGIGGLIKVAYFGTETTDIFPAFDASGNSVELINAMDGTVCGTYAYGPYGEALRSTGPMANRIPLQFSSKYRDDETGLVYYGYRSYSPSTGSWLSMDPAGEASSLNCYAFVANDPSSKLDLLGLSTMWINEEYYLLADWYELANFFFGPTIFHITVPFNSPFPDPTIPTLWFDIVEPNRPVHVSRNGGVSPDQYKLPPNCKWIPHTLIYTDYEDNDHIAEATGHNYQYGFLGADEYHVFLQRVIRWTRKACCRDGPS